MPAKAGKPSSAPSNAQDVSGIVGWALAISVADHPINGGAFPTNVITSLLAFVPFMKLDFALHFLPLAIKAGVLDPLIHGFAAGHVFATTHGHTAFNKLALRIVIPRLGVNTGAHGS